MKKAKLICLSTLVAAGLNTSAQAQETRDYEPYPYTFVGVQGGVQNTFNSSFNNWKTFTPTAAISLGHFFTPIVGARLHVNGMWNKAAAYSVPGAIYAPSTTPEQGRTGYFKYNYVNTNADVMVNLVNLFGKKDYYPVNLYLIGGIGMYHAWNNDEAVQMYNGVPHYEIANYDKEKRNAFNGRLGLQLDVQLCKNVSFNIEGTYNMHAGDRDKFAKENDQLVLLAGLNFKFGHKKVAKEEIEAIVAEVPEVWETVVDTTWYDDVTYKDVVKPGDIDKRIFFNVGASEVESTDAQIAAVAEFLKGVQNGEITITAYADKGTGTPQRNMQYAKARAEKTKAALIAKGVDPKMIKAVEWKGDTVQPYAENDKNRVSIITGKGVYKQQEKVVTKKFKTKERKVRVQ